MKMKKEMIKVMKLKEFRKKKEKKMMDMKKLLEKEKK
jgi:hypothetical protein